MAGESRLKQLDNRLQKGIRRIMLNLGLEKRDPKIDGPDPNLFTGFDDIKKKSKGGQIKKYGVQKKGTSPLLKKRK